ncbi:hypothetical protein DSCO28_66850 [Desulfosarcina ovata subsp. sediminis]|uniref:Uncharacterized protein n=1 Tax=Desulfosarcina ovata subsp. sediminis TaxID=885957 RepID=A0A5K8A0N7_9BACT|nr:hypothetical protein DSCO28_66850 [Desulfosarcina ovata subsp. sediminis]
MSYGCHAFFIEKGISWTLHALTALIEHMGVNHGGGYVFVSWEFLMILTVLPWRLRDLNHAYNVIEL